MRSPHGSHAFLLEERQQQPSDNGSGSVRVKAGAAR
jgi:hypothetical protein